MRRWFGNPADRADALLAGALSLVGLLSLVPYSDRELHGSSAPFAVLVTLLLCLPLAVRRRAPRLVLAAVVAAAAAIWLSGLKDNTSALAGSIALYGAGRHLDRPASFRVFGTAAATLGLVAAWVALHAGQASGGATFVGRCSVIVAAFWVGDSQRSRVTLVEVLREQARRAETERLGAERRAVLEERGRISRELHDVVAHSLSVMVIQAVAASRLIDRDPARASDSISHVADTGRSALTEMRNVLGGLHDDGTAADYAPLPTLADLDALVDRCRAAGLAVTVHRQGDLPELTAGVQLSVVRVVQEALTNVMKHSPQARAVVRLTTGRLGAGSGATCITVEVTDDGADPALEQGALGKGAVTTASGDGRGRGLIGLRERVEALGGTFRAGPAAGGGFAVHAVVPAGGRS